MTAPTAPRPAGARITRDDIEAKFREVQGDVEEVEEQARDYLGIAVVAGVSALVVLAFVLGRRKGRRARTFVEIRRL
jgi:hypothetical protein